MDREQWTDQLTETFLGEWLSDEEPPDLTARILERAGRSRPLPVFRWAAAAAALIVAGLIWNWLPVEPPKHVEAPSPRPAYAAPVISGDYRVEGPGPIERGAIVHTTEGVANLNIGGYADVMMKPGSTVQLAGAEGAEEIILTRGEIECEVDADAEKLFTVQTELGTVSVVGTRFTVQLTGEETAMNGKKMLVKVLAGAVLVTGLTGAQSVVNTAQAREFGRRGARPQASRQAGTTIADAKTPIAKESVALRLQERALREKQRELEGKILQDTGVAAAMKAMFDAMAASDAALEANPEYADMKKERAKMSTDMRGMWGGGRGRGNREARQERMNKFREMRKQSGELREKMAKLAGEVKGLAALKAKKDEAVAAFLSKYQAVLDADKGYAEVGEQLAKVRVWARAAGEKIGAERAERRRAERDERRKKAEELKKQEEKPEEVENPFP